jgi:hypothetical protein
VEPENVLTGLNISLENYTQIPIKFSKCESHAGFGILLDEVKQ